MSTKRIIVPQLPREVLDVLAAGKAAGRDGPLFGKEKLDPAQLLATAREMVAAGALPPAALSRFEHFGDNTFVFRTSCDACNAAAASLCARCGVQRVCSRECQRALWAAHKAPCAAAAAALAAPPAPPELEFIFRVDGEDEVPQPRAA